MIRPLTCTDIRAIADELRGTDDSLPVAMGSLGFDPFLFEDGEVEDWLREETGLIQSPDTGIWKVRTEIRGMRSAREQRGSHRPKRTAPGKVPS